MNNNLAVNKIIHMMAFPLTIPHVQTSNLGHYQDAFNNVRGCR